MKTSLMDQNPFFTLTEQFQLELNTLKQSVAICQQQVQELENADAEITTRQVEVNNVAASLQELPDSQRHNNQFQGNNQQKESLQTHITKLNSELEEWFRYMVEGREKTLAQIVQTRNLGVTLQNKLSNEILLTWKRKQKIGQIGANMETLNSELDAMEPLFDALLTELVRFKSAVDGFSRHLRRLLINNQFDPNAAQVDLVGVEINEQITSLLWECCVVAVQPPSILMMTRTPASDHQRKGGRPPCQPVLRFLGGTRLGIRSQPIGVQCYLVSEEEAPKLLARDAAAMDEIVKSRSQKTQKKDALPQLMNNEATMLENTDRFFATFLRMHITKRERQAQAGDATTDRIRIPKKKYYFTFVIELTGAGISKPLRIWRLSLPVGVFSHPKQVWEQGGDASLFWSLAFSKGDGVMTDVDPNGVPVHEVVSRLNDKFLQHTQATRGLNLNAQKHLARRLTHCCFSGEIPMTLITWRDFYETNVGQDDSGFFTFRDWFYSVMEIVTSRKGLLEQWNAGLILGFAGRDEVDQYLKAQKEKTLSIKFSDSKRDLIISYGQAGHPVLHVLPVPEQLPMLGALPVEQVVRTTTQLQDIRWVLGQADEIDGSDKIKPIEWLWKATETVNDHKTSRSSQKSDSSDPGSQDPYKRLQLKLGLDGQLSVDTTSVQAQAQQQFLIGPTPSTTDIGLELDPELLDLLNDPSCWNSPESATTLSMSPDTYDFSVGESMMSM